MAPDEGHVSRWEQGRLASPETGRASTQSTVTLDRDPLGSHRRHSLMRSTHSAGAPPPRTVITDTAERGRSQPRVLAAPALSRHKRVVSGNGTRQNRVPPDRCRARKAHLFRDTPEEALPQLGPEETRGRCPKHSLGSSGRQVTSAERRLRTWSGLDEMRLTAARDAESGPCATNGIRARWRPTRSRGRQGSRVPMSIPTATAALCHTPGNCALKLPGSGQQVNSLLSCEAQKKPSSSVCLQLWDLFFLSFPQNEILTHTARAPASLLNQISRILLSLRPY